MAPNDALHLAPEGDQSVVEPGIRRVGDDREGVRGKDLGVRSGGVAPDAVP